MIRAGLLIIPISTENTNTIYTRYNYIDQTKNSNFEKKYLYNRPGDYKKRRVITTITQLVVILKNTLTLLKFPMKFMKSLNSFFILLPPTRM